MEFIEHHYDTFDITVLTTQPETFRRNLSDIGRITLVSFESPYPQFSPLHHPAELRWLGRHSRAWFQAHPLGPQDILYSSSDIGPDILNGYRAKAMFSCLWLASMFLFLPSPIENLRGRYRFPFFKYVGFHAYQRALFWLILRRADACLLTNDVDRGQFPSEWENRLFAVYGGVNIDVIEQAERLGPWPGRRYDGVFCGRLHPQKGPDRLLAIWRHVVDRLPNAQLAIIGNGEEAYEQFLHRRAERLCLNGNITWLGYVNGVDKYRTYLSSKVLLQTTIYDNNGMVSAEALCTGLPVVMFDLPSLQHVYADGCCKVPEGDMAAFADAVAGVIGAASARGAVAPSVVALAKWRRAWDWNERLRLLNDFMRQVLSLDTTYRGRASR